MPSVLVERRGILAHRLIPEDSRIVETSSTTMDENEEIDLDAFGSDLLECLDDSNPQDQPERTPKEERSAVYSQAASFPTYDSSVARGTSQQVAGMGAPTQISVASTQRHSGLSNDQSSTNSTMASGMASFAALQGIRLPTGNQATSGSLSNTPLASFVQQHPQGIPSTAPVPTISIDISNPSLQLACSALSAGIDISQFLPTLLNTQQASVQPATSQSQTAGSTPFMLFGAPAEMRHNYIEAQKAKGVPPLNDSNSFYYNHAGNGTAPPPLVDGRHADQGSKRIKNEKEQKRAQRITELIDELREAMAESGWESGVKSKLHTLAK